MALNSTGPISIGGSTTGQSINLELGRSATATSTMNESTLRTLAGVASGAISLNNFYGKSNQQPVSWSMLIMAGGGGTIDTFYGSIYTGTPGTAFPATIDDDLWTSPVIADDDWAVPDASYYIGQGGGGAGGLVTTTGTNTGGSLYITVGAAGSGTTIGGSSYYATSSGGAAVVSATGGGSGAYGGTKNGGSGGGRSSNGYTWSQGDAAAGTGIAGQGNAGGSKGTYPAPYIYYGGQGGGGGQAAAGAAGIATSPYTGGNGGTGYDLVNFRGGSSAVVAYGGGGAGMGTPSTTNGSNGSSTYTTYTPPANTGGGARGCSWYATFGTTGNRTRTGGSGRVIVRYAGTTAKATGGNSTYTATVGGTAYYFHEFTSSGTLTFT